MRTQNFILFSDFSMVQDGYSPAINIELVTGYSAQAVWSSSPTGYLFIQVSNDAPFGNTEPTNWTLIDRSLVPTNGVAGDAIWKQHMAAFRWVRFGYAFGSGTGTLNARLSCKGTS